MDKLIKLKALMTTGGRYTYSQKVVHDEEEKKAFLESENEYIEGYWNRHHALYLDLEGRTIGLKHVIEFYPEEIPLVEGVPIKYTKRKNRRREPYIDRREREIDHSDQPACESVPLGEEPFFDFNPLNY